MYAYFPLFVYPIGCD